MEVFGFVALTDQTPPHIFPYQSSSLWTVERRPESGKSLLNTFMARAVGVLEQLGPERRGRRYKDAPLEQGETIGHGPTRIGCAIPDCLKLVDDLW